MLSKPPKGYRFTAKIIHHCVYLYHRFNISYRDIEEMMAVRGVRVSYESIRKWYLKFSHQYASVLRYPSHILTRRKTLFEYSVYGFNLYMTRVSHLKNNFDRMRKSGNHSNTIK